MEMDIRDNWEKLSPSTQQWLTDNPGCMILPRTITSIIHQETGGTADGDRHGAFPLSQADHDFIMDKARCAPPSSPAVGSSGPTRMPRTE